MNGCGKGEVWEGWRRGKGRKKGGVGRMVEEFGGDMRMGRRNGRGRGGGEWGGITSHFTWC